MLDNLRSTLTEDMARQRLSRTAARTPALRGVRSATEQSIRGIWRRLKKDGPASDDDENAIADSQAIAAAPAYSRNIENFIGTVKVPLGVIGPLRINGTVAELFLRDRADSYQPIYTPENTPRGLAL